MNILIPNEDKCYLDTNHSTKTQKRGKTDRDLKQKPSIVDLTMREQRCKWRIALYSHDTMGLGHKRRNLLIAQALGASELSADILMISGTREASNFSTPQGIDCLTLPALYKNAKGNYRSRRWEMPLNQIIRLRSKVIRATIKTFKPDLFIVDNVPRGAMGELNSTLKYLKSQKHTRCILGLRDILDEPRVIRKDWRSAANEEAIRQYYHAVWVYGDQSVYNLTEEYRFAPDVAAKFHYTGYLDQRFRLNYTDADQEILSLPSKRLALCVVGGGQDGGFLAEAFAQTDLPPDTSGIILTGPMMPPEIRQRLQMYAVERSNLEVLEYVAEPTLLLRQADWVIAMGGYNTTCEILSFQKRALIVPRIQPRREQFIRTERLEQLGLLEMLHPQDVNPHALTTWLAQDKPPSQQRSAIDLNGLQRIGQLVEEILTPVRA